MYKRQGVRNTNLSGHILEVRTAVVVVTQIYLILEYLVEKGSDCKFFPPSGFALDKTQIFELIVGNRGRKLH